MQSTVTSPQTSRVTAPKNRFRTVLGFAALSRDSSDTDTPTPTDNRSLTFTRQSIDTARSYANRQKKRADRSSVAHISFFQRDLQPPHTTTLGNTSPIVDFTLDQKMTVDSTHSTRRTPVRIDHEGPWSVSVAETPHDTQSYSLYIKSESFTSASIFFARVAVQL